jgi:hypothetical protein
MSNIQVKRIKEVKSQFWIVSEIYRLEGKSPFVSAFKKLDTQVKNLIKR